MYLALLEKLLLLLLLSQTLCRVTGLRAKAAELSPAAQVKGQSQGWTVRRRDDMPRRVIRIDS